MQHRDTNLIFTADAAAALADAVCDIVPSGVYVLADSNTASAVAAPLIARAGIEPAAPVIEVPAGDRNKSLDSLASVWRTLSDAGATRHSLLVNVGGGMITDLGGFAAATFKRGIPFVNIPTSLLGAVDAALGGKTAINFNGLKNEIGVFAPARAVIVDTQLFASLPQSQLVSGYAELLKHALLDGAEHLSEALAYDLAGPDLIRLQELLRQSVGVKQRIVAADPFESGLRKSLNLGHTPAHAYESLAMSRGEAVDHGVAVAWGLVTDLVLSHLRLGFPSETLQQVAAFVREYYPRPGFSCADCETLIAYMRHDKKNLSSHRINFTLLEAPGRVKIDCEVPVPDITAALDITRDLLPA